MSLNAAQKTTLFLALGIPQSDTVIVFGPAKSNSPMIPYADSADIEAIVDAIETRLTAIALISDEEAKLIVMLSAWETLQTSGTGALIVGDIGEIRRINYDPNEARLFLRSQIEKILGIYVSQEFLDSITGEGGSGSCGCNGKLCV